MPLFLYITQCDSEMMVFLYMKYIYLLLALFCMAGCKDIKKNKEQEVIRVSVLRGPSAIAFAQWMGTPPVIDGKTVSVTLADSPDIIQAALIKKETDIAALPMISAVNLYNKGVDYPLLGCPVWGTLYLVGRDNPTDKKVLHLFGAGTTPDILTRYYLDINGEEYALNYSFGTAREIMQALLIGKAQTAVLSEPFVSMALRKDNTLHILADLTNPANNSALGFPQTAIVYNTVLKNETVIIDSLLQSSCRFVEEHPEDAIRILEEHQVFAPGMLTVESLKRCRIHYLTANDACDATKSFLRLIEQYEPKAIGGKVPESFIP